MKLGLILLFTLMRLLDEFSALFSNCAVYDKKNIGQYIYRLGI